MNHPIHFPLFGSLKFLASLNTESIKKIYVWFIYSEKKTRKKSTHKRKRSAEDEEAGEDNTIRKNRKRAQDEDDDSDEGKDANVGSGNDDNKEESAKDSGDDYDLGQYEYLLGETHYDDDKEDSGVFKCMEITVEDDIIVVYRSKYNTKTKKWGKVNLEDPIHVDDIEKCHRNKKFIKIMNSILCSKPSKP